MSQEKRKWRSWPMWLLGGWIATQLAFLFAQVLHPQPFGNDSVFHFGLIRSLASAPGRGQGLLDPWVRTWGMGYPVFHYYQNLPHLLVLAVWKLSFGALSLLRAFKVVEWLAIGTFPLAVFLAARKLGFGRGASAAAGLLALWPRTAYLHGLSLESYTFQGLGMFSQAVGCWFLPLAIAWTWAALREGRGLAKAALLMTVTLMCHLALGYMAFLIAGIAALIAPGEILRRLRRLAVVTAITVAASAYMIVPILRDFEYYNVSDLVPSWKYNSFGHAIVLGRLFHGELFDFMRLPALTLLVGLGVGWAAVRWARHASGRLRQPEPERLLLASFVAFLLLYFGRPTWGRLLDLFPLGSGFHWSRTLVVVHLAGTMLAGVAAADLLRRLAGRSRLRLAGAIVLAAAVAAVPLTDRVGYLRLNAGNMKLAAASFETERADLDSALDLAAEDRDGRVYAGVGGLGAPGWGGAFRVGYIPVYSWFPLREMDAFGYLHHQCSLNSDFHDSFRENNRDHYRVFNVRRIIAPPEVQAPYFAHEIGRFGRFRVLAVDGPGFIELVDVPYRVDVPKSNISRVHRAWLKKLAPLRVHPEVRIVGERASAGDAPLLNAFDVAFPEVDPPAGPAGEVLDVQRTGDDFTAEVRADRPCAAVLKMTYHPGWRVTLDGRDVEAMHLLPSFVAVAVPPGTHEVSFRWDPGPLKRNLLIAGLALAGLLAVAAGRLGG